MSIIDQAKAEMERAGIVGDDAAAMVHILETFFNQWDSGGAVSVMQPVLVRLISGQPLSPLTGADDEWIERDFDQIYQNARCSTVFKDAKDGPAYDTQSGRRVAVTFPYDPPTRVLGDPVLLVETRR